MANELTRTTITAQKAIFLFIFSAPVWNSINIGVERPQRHSPHLTCRAYLRHFTLRPAGPPACTRMRSTLAGAPLRLLAGQLMPCLAVSRIKHDRQRREREHDHQRYRSQHLPHPDLNEFLVGLLHHNCSLTELLNLSAASRKVASPRWPIEE